MEDEPEEEEDEGHGQGGDSYEVGEVPANLVSSLNILSKWDGRDGRTKVSAATKHSVSG